MGSAPKTPRFRHCLSLIPKNSRSKPANIFGLFTTTTFITRSFQHLKRNIPRTISSTAITNSITFSEKNEIHIIAPRNAAAARHSPAFERLCRLGFLRRNIPFTSLFFTAFGFAVRNSAAFIAYYSFFLKSVTYFFEKILVYYKKLCYNRNKAFIQNNFGGKIWKTAKNTLRAA